MYMYTSYCISHYIFINHNNKLVNIYKYFLLSIVKSIGIRFSYYIAGHFLGRKGIVEILRRNHYIVTNIPLTLQIEG